MRPSGRMLPGDVKRYVRLQIEHPELFEDQDEGADAVDWAEMLENDPYSPDFCVFCGCTPPAHHEDCQR